MISLNSLTRVLITALMLTLSGIPELMAQGTQAQTPQTTNTNANNSQSQSGNTSSQGSTSDPRFSGVKPDPSAGPQSPTLSPQAPESPSPIQPQQEQQQLPTAPSPQPSADTSTQPAQPVTQRENPVGTAAAEKGVTRGGAASKPAGTAIAPAKQRQVRSLLIKLGVVAAAGVAVGTVLGLSKGSPTTPPGTSKASTASR
jgi:hypothetical protein